MITFANIDCPTVEEAIIMPA